MPELPEADVFIHAGDFMNSGKHLYEIISFNNWLEKVPVRKYRRFVVGGNHDSMFDEYHISSGIREAATAREHLTNCVYVQDEEVVVEGIKFYFSPWTPEFFGWGFNAHRGPEIAEIWAKIPDDVDVLVTHGPPYGILDQIVPGVETQLNSHHIGCEDLLGKIQKIHPRYHIFGHIHGSRGVAVRDHTTFINASFLKEDYKPYGGDQSYHLLEIDEVRINKE